MSLNVALGGVVPIGWVDFEITEYDDFGNQFDFYVPYIFANFSPGASFMGGMQYNINRRFSVEGRVYTFFLWDWSYMEDADLGWWSNSSLEFWHMSFGVTPKIYARPGKKINPFGFAEFNVSYNDIYVYLEGYYDPEFDEFIEPEDIELISSDLTFGTYLGIGTDINIIPNLSLFAQTGYYITFLGQEMEDNYGEWENFTAIRGEVGVKLNLFKSKQL
ncbi:MAG: hypothetical protein C0599_05675 [Salinivirgaceae bacterium]|nr:MAG: hypothetical protein C0599_05675 [Salinivirgaceae bacterium]